jgi:hypothetical protein
MQWEQAQGGDEGGAGHPDSRVSPEHLSQRRDDDREDSGRAQGGENPGKPFSEQPVDVEQVMA